MVLTVFLGVIVARPLWQQYLISLGTGVPYARSQEYVHTSQVRY